MNALRARVDYWLRCRRVRRYQDSFRGVKDHTERVQAMARWH